MHRKNPWPRTDAFLPHTAFPNWSPALPSPPSPLTNFAHSFSKANGRRGRPAGKGWGKGELEDNAGVQEDPSARLCFNGQFSEKSELREKKRPVFPPPLHPRSATRPPAKPDRGALRLPRAPPLRCPLRQGPSAQPGCRQSAERPPPSQLGRSARRSRPPSHPAGQTGPPATGAADPERERENFGMASMRRNQIVL